MRVFYYESKKEVRQALLDSIKSGLLRQTLEKDQVMDQVIDEAIRILTENLKSDQTLKK